jgi:hypothetical protein
VLNASACADAWLGGTLRYVTYGAYGARIGFHAPSDKHGNESGVGQAYSGAYYARLGLPNRAIIYLSETPPNSIRWLTKNDADNVGIDVVWLGRDEFPSIWMARPTSPQAQPQQLPPPQASPAPPIAAEPTPSLEERARRFVDAIFGARNQAALDWLHVRYKDTTRYYGK